MFYGSAFLFQILFQALLLVVVVSACPLLQEAHPGVELIHVQANVLDGLEELLVTGLHGCNMISLAAKLLSQVDQAPA